MLLDTSVDVTDSSGVTRPAPLFFIQPTQINLQIPLGTALGPADVRVNRASGVPFLGSFQVERVAPGIFSADGSGQGVAAALFQRTEEEGPDTIDFIFDRTTKLSVPIDLGSGDQRVFLLLFGTGIRGVSGRDQVTATVGGENVKVQAAVAQGEFLGLDQVNIGPLDRDTFQGRGEVDLVLTVEGRATNTVTVNFQ